MTFDHALLHSLMETTSWIWTSLEQMLLGQVTNLKWQDFCDVVFTYKKIAMFKFLKNLVQMDPNQKCNSRSRKLLLRHLDGDGNIIYAL